MSKMFSDNFFDGFDFSMIFGTTPEEMKEFREFVCASTDKINEIPDILEDRGEIIRVLRCPKSISGSFQKYCREQILWLELCKAEAEKKRKVRECLMSAPGDRANRVIFLKYFPKVGRLNLSHMLGGILLPNLTTWSNIAPQLKLAAVNSATSCAPETVTGEFVFSLLTSAQTFGLGQLTFQSRNSSRRPDWVFVPKSLVDAVEEDLTKLSTNIIECKGLMVDDVDLALVQGIMYQIQLRGGEGLLSLSSFSGLSAAVWMFGKACPVFESMGEKHNVPVTFGLQIAKYSVTVEGDDIKIDWSRESRPSYLSVSTNGHVDLDSMKEIEFLKKFYLLARDETTVPEYEDKDTDKEDRDGKEE